MNANQTLKTNHSVNADHSSKSNSSSNAAHTLKAPYALTAELTHRCPLHCAYCSNPLELQKRENELGTADWLRVLDEAAELGVAHVHFTGGEPLLRQDLEQLVRRARELGLFVNMITSGVGLTRERVRRLAEAGVDSMQLSVQASDGELSDRIAGIKSHELKRRAAEWIKAEGIPLQANAVLHRHNLHQVEEIIDLCVSWGAERLELANVQYYGWAFANREYLLPSLEQLQAAEAAYMRSKARLGGVIELIWIVPDYYAEYPKPCMGGWASISFTVTPDGRALPCTAAAGIETLRFDSVKERSLGWIWQESEAFTAFRGEDWMPEPCRSCDRRHQDFGGCRCQAYLLTGDARNADPVCALSPDHWRLADFVASRGASARSRAAGGENDPAITAEGDRDPPVARMRGY
ncbi:pyrroloquinoline quinone biosynthesis protein PqqE [Cohnella lubricantis]|uniref:PqqA peptide cyclase n=1 Tax=Cohnella lubricantis TaxID=2163172 RepID=A0A841T7K4_9BACL|nr:pyrroloquinoline quinone biosynthesis protein PqqE [Cohnella lubricantis]